MYYIISSGSGLFLFGLVFGWVFFFFFFGSLEIGGFFFFFVIFLTLKSFRLHVLSTFKISSVLTIFGTQKLLRTLRRFRPRKFPEKKLNPIVALLTYSLSCRTYRRGNRWWEKTALNKKLHRCTFQIR